MSRRASILRVLWRLLNVRQRWQLVGLQMLSVLMALSTVGGVAAVLPFFAALSDPGAIAQSRFAAMLLQRLGVDPGSMVSALGAAFAVSVLVANTINLIGLLAINRFAGRVGESLYAELFTEYLHRDYQFHACRGGSALAAKVQESARVTSGIVQYALVLVASAVTILFIVAAALWVNPLIAIVAVSALGICYATLYGAARRRLWRNGQSEYRLRTERMRTVSEAFDAIKDVTLLRAQEFFAERFARQSRGISQAGASTFAISQSPKYVLECLTVVCLVGVALYLRSRVGASGPWVGQLTFVGFAAYRLLPALQLAFNAIVNIRTDRAAFAAIEDDLHHRRNPRSACIASADVSWRGRPRRTVEACGVTFRYSPDLPPALEEVSLLIPAGAIVGFKGLNGSGKSTLLDVLSGLLLPQAGHVEIDGIRLDASNLISWQANIAYVPQQVQLLEATLAENIAFGVEASKIDPQRLRHAVQLASLTECLAQFPDGYNERLGQSGRGLSGGERQRVAIARALYRDASVLLFDEATSSLDNRVEYDVGEMLKSLRADRTILIVAHRAGALRQCDVVHELKSGRLVEAQSAMPALAGSGHE